jgi:hypothetical protein
MPLEDNFEQQWRQAFDNAKLLPPNSVWDQIYLRLKPNYARVYSWIFILWLFVGVALIPNHKAKVSTHEFTKFTHDLEGFDFCQDDIFSNRFLSFLPIKPSQMASLIHSKKNFNFNFLPTHRDSLVSQPMIVSQNRDWEKESNFSTNFGGDTLDYRSLQNFIPISFDSLDFTLSAFEIKKACLPLAKESFTIPEKQKKSFFVQLGFSPMYYSSNLKPHYNKFLQTYIQAHQLSKIKQEGYFDALKESYTPLFSFQTDFTLGLRLHDRLNLRTGFLYQKTAYQQTTNAFFKDPISGSVHSFWCIMLRGEIANQEYNQTAHNHPAYQTATSLDWDLSTFNPELLTTKLKVEQQFFSIPVLFEYQVSSRSKIKKSVLGGFFQDFLRSTTLESTFLDNLTSSRDGRSLALNQSNYSWMLGWQLSMPVSPKMELMGQAFYRSSLFHQFEKQSYTDSKPTIFGIGLALRYNFSLQNRY